MLQQPIHDAVDGDVELQETTCAVRAGYIEISMCACSELVFDDDSINTNEYVAVGRDDCNDNDEYECYTPFWDVTVFSDRPLACEEGNRDDTFDTTIS